MAGSSSSERDSGAFIISTHSIQIHEICRDLFRSLDPEEGSLLEASIKEHGVHVPLLVDQEDVLLDGHHRLAICQRLGIETVPVRRITVSPDEREARVIECNAARRHLRREERQAIYRRKRLEGATQAEAAKAAGVAQQTGSDWERGESNTGSGNGLAVQDDTGSNSLSAQALPPADKRRKLSERQEAEITSRADEPTKQVAEEFGVSEQRVRAIRKKAANTGLEDQKPAGKPQADPDEEEAWEDLPPELLDAAKAAISSACSQISLLGSRTAGLVDESGPAAELYESFGRQLVNHLWSQLPDAFSPRAAVASMLRTFARERLRLLDYRALAHHVAFNGHRNDCKFIIDYAKLMIENAIGVDAKGLAPEQWREVERVKRRGCRKEIPLEEVEDALAEWFRACLVAKGMPTPEPEITTANLDSADS